VGDIETSYRVRLATTDDIAIMIQYRRAMFESMGVSDQAALERMCAAMAGYLAQAIPSGEYLGWVADVAGDVVASGGLVIRSLPPSPRNMDGRQGYIMNVFTCPEWRRRGIATAIMQAILAYLKQAGVPVATLHASAAGRPMYEQMGFQPTNEMRLVLDDAQKLI
jgi:GNAT superfamily N-acetyltransferase